MTMKMFCFQQNKVKNIIEEIQSAKGTQKMPVYNVDKLSLDVLRKEQWRDRLCKNKVKEIKTKPDPNFILDEHSILIKVVKLKYTVEPTIVIPKKINKPY